MTSTATRPYLPAMGQRRLLPLYDAFARVVGARAAQWRLVAQAGISPTDTVLEIGAGTGAVLLMVKRAVPTARVVGLDPDADALEVARRRAVAEGLELRLDRGYADRLPQDDGSVDRVLSSFMFHHLPADEKAAALAEARRVLAPGGSLHLVDIRSEAQRVETLMRDAGFTGVAVVGRARTLVGPVTFYRAEPG